MFGTDGIRNAVHAPADQAAAVNAINTLFPLGARSDALRVSPHPSFVFDGVHRYRV